MRTQRCVFCNGTEGETKARIRFWDITEGHFVTCPCGHTQLDPMLTSEQVALGCRALHHLQQSAETERSLRRGFLRAFTKGMALGITLRLQRARITEILELGPGDGFVTRGIQVFYPKARVTALDIVADSLEFIAKAHGYETFLGTPEDIERLPDASFDLIVARDILEHTANPGRVIREAHRILRPGGYFHFITPNGREDLWSFELLWRGGQKTGELLLTHVPYFDAVQLKQALERTGFKLKQYYLYSLKWTRRGRGWRNSPRLQAPETQSRSAQSTIDAHPAIARGDRARESSALTRRWWACGPGKWLGGIFWNIHHVAWLRLPARLRLGHEIFGLAKKTA